MHISHIKNFGTVNGQFTFADTQLNFAILAVVEFLGVKWENLYLPIPVKVSW